MADFGRRFGSLLLAGVFLVSTFGVTAIIFWESRQNNDNQQALQQAQSVQELQEQLNEQENKAGEEVMLQGTLLTDFTPVSEPVTELQVLDIKEGDGETVQAGATVTADYTGAYAVNGEIFQSSKDMNGPIPFSLNEVIKGWTDGVPGMKVGGIRRLVIPGNLAYGEAPEGYKPGDSERPLGPLVFDIELVAVEQ